ncbi:enoyl-CoA hydratase/isomerase family protein [Tumebacillus sp. ITR2]|uniref:Enoyl-CoA hydratase/isomerase family protein n=1 Tax=Tumebacillus amylolyticus TaxID=2801339 RepID=A0ABS1J510_9BACL|nr:enoyl-CoA hydratase-related protein [Tumebacillus amylolyticus]MBL0385364.1 enoyl-CoA hydratase/isomerase family protein [Tumebacillus amylolyticus]
MTYENLLFEVRDHIGFITLNRPKSLNALNSSLLRELGHLLDEIKTNDDIRAVIITGTGEKAFAAGADISEMQPMTAIQGRKFSADGMDSITKLETLPQPTIAAVNGFALGGGCEVVLACDMRIASTNAKFGQPEVNLGVTPGFGATQRLPRLVGAGIAKELLLTGDVIGAERAHQIGLVNHVVEPENLMEKAIEIATKIAGKGQLSVRMTKQGVNEGMNMDVERGLQYETELFALSFSTEDQKEGMQAFLEKRPANFQGK